MTIKRTTTIAAVAFGAAIFVASAASAGVTAPQSEMLPAESAAHQTPAPKALDKTGVQQAFHGGRHRYCRYGRVLPRRAVRHRLFRQGWFRIGRLHYRPGRRVFASRRWHDAAGYYVTTATRGFYRHGGYRRYRLTVSACTGRVIRAYHLRYRGY